MKINRWSQLRRSHRPRKNGKKSILSGLSLTVLAVLFVKLIAARPCDSRGYQQREEIGCFASLERDYPSLPGVAGAMNRVDRTPIARETRIIDAISEAVNAKRLFSATVVIFDTP